MRTRNDFGSWTRPAHGRLRKRPSPRLRATRAVLENLLALPREGSGDYRRRAAVLTGNTTSSSPDARFYNPSKVQVPSGHRMAQEPPVYVPRRNGLPEPRRYDPQAGDWRAKGWEARVLASGLDLAAILAADQAIERASREDSRRNYQRYAPRAGNGYRPRQMRGDGELAELARRQEAGQ